MPVVFWQKYSQKFIFFCGWLLFPLEIKQETVVGTAAAPGGKLGLAHLGDISKGTIRELTLIVPIVRAISVTCLINPFSVCRLALPGDVPSQDSVKEVKRGTPRR